MDSLLPRADVLHCFRARLLTGTLLSCRIAVSGLCATNVVTSSVFSLLASFFPQMAEERGLSPFTVVSASFPIHFSRLQAVLLTLAAAVLQGAIFGSFALIIFVSSPLLGLYMSR